jgi:hypothetical protein
VNKISDIKQEQEQSTQDKTRQDTRQDQARLKSGNRRKKELQDLQVGDTLYIEEIQIPHKTSTTYTERGVITCVIVIITSEATQHPKIITLISATTQN